MFQSTVSDLRCHLFFVVACVCIWTDCLLQHLIDEFVLHTVEFALVTKVAVLLIVPVPSKSSK